MSTIDFKRNAENNPSSSTDSNLKERSLQKSPVIGKIDTHFVKEELKTLKTFSKKKLGDWLEGGGESRKKIINNIEFELSSKEKQIKKLLILEKAKFGKNSEDLFEAVKNIENSSFKNNHPSYGGDKDVDDIKEEKDILDLKILSHNNDEIVTGYCTEEIKSYLGDALTRAQDLNYLVLSHINRYYNLMILKSKLENKITSISTSISPEEKVKLALEELDEQAKDTENYKNIK